MVGGGGRRAPAPGPRGHAGRMVDGAGRRPRLRGRMHPLLRRTARDPWGDRELRDLLLSAPWCWPTPDGQDERRALDLALTVTGTKEPPFPRPGRVPLLAVNETGASLWRLDVPARGAPPASTAVPY